MRRAPFLLALLAIAVTSLAGDQSALEQPLATRTVAAPKGLTMTQHHGHLYFNTNIGSFRIVGSDKDMSEGTLDMTFRGSLLVSQLAPGSTLVITGNIRKELEDGHGRTVYFGQGRVTIEGRFRAVQFFGNDLRASFDGFGIAQLIGEFDKNLDTGYYWYDGDKIKEYWQTSLMTVAVPKPTLPKPQIKIEGGG